MNPEYCEGCDKWFNGPWAYDRHKCAAGNAEEES